MTPSPMLACEHLQCLHLLHSSINWKFLCTVWWCLDLNVEHIAAWKIGFLCVCCWLLFVECMESSTNCPRQDCWRNRKRKSGLCFHCLDNFPLSTAKKIEIKFIKATLHKNLLHSSIKLLIKFHSDKCYKMQFYLTAEIWFSFNSLEPLFLILSIRLTSGWELINS